MLIAMERGSKIEPVVVDAEVARISRPLRAIPVDPRAPIEDDVNVPDRDPPFVSDAPGGEEVADEVLGALLGADAARGNGAIGRVDLAVAVEQARVDRLAIAEAVIDAERERVLVLFGDAAERRQADQRVGGRERRARET